MNLVPNSLSLFTNALRYSPTLSSVNLCILKRLSTLGIKLLTKIFALSNLSIFIFFFSYPLPGDSRERMIKFKDYLMFHPKSKQTLLRISNLNKFLHVFYNHKYYSFYI